MPLTEGLSALLDSVPETTPVLSEEIAFERDGVQYGGFVAAPAASAAAQGRGGPSGSGDPLGGSDLLPAVLIFSDWSGLGDHARVRAQMLARLGYIGLAGDVYGGGVSLPPEQCEAEAGRFYRDPALFRARVAANLAYLRALPGVDPDRIAVMGYCFGGSAGLELVRSGAAIAGAVSFHGRLVSGQPAQPGDVKTPVLVLTGAADPVVPDEQVVGFENEMRQAEAPDWQIVSYSGAMHAFTMPDANAPEYGAAFDAVANARSWVAMRAFFDEIFA